MGGIVQIASLTRIGIYAGGRFSSAGRTYVQANYYFHITTAHGILRHNGLLIGKTDYLGNLD